MFRTMKPIFALILLSAFICTPTASFAQTAREFQEIKQTLMALRAELSDVRRKSFAIGSVQQSFLTEAEFQKQMGSNWVLCDGRTVPGSRWEQLGYGSVIPNCAGQFLRSSGGNAAPLRSKQEQATALNGIAAKATTSLSSSMNVNVSGRTNDASWTGALATTITDSASGSNNAYTGLEAWANGKVGNDGIYWSQMFSHYHDFTASGTATGGAWSTRIELTGDSETRPGNLTVNTFLKVN